MLIPYRVDKIATVSLGKCKGIFIFETYHCWPPIERTGIPCGMHLSILWLGYILLRLVVHLLNFFPSLLSPSVYTYRGPRRHARRLRKSRRPRGGGHDSETEAGYVCDVIARRRREIDKIADTQNRDVETEDREAEDRVRRRRPQYGGCGPEMTMREIKKSRNQEMRGEATRIEKSRNVRNREAIKK